MCGSRFFQGETIVVELTYHKGLPTVSTVDGSNFSYKKKYVDRLQLDYSVKIP